MKKRGIALLLLTMVVFAGCGPKDRFAQWEEDLAYAAFKVIEAGLIKQGDANKDTIDLSEGNYIYYAVNTEEDFLANQEEDIFYLSSAYGMNVTDPFYKGINGYSNLFIGMDGKGIVSETDAPFDESNKEKLLPLSGDW